MPSPIEQIIARVQALSPEQIEVTDYARSRAVERRIDVGQALRNIVSRNDGTWRFSSFGGAEGRRVEILFRVSPRRIHKYVLEVNERVWLINAMIINTRKQKRLRHEEY